MNLSEKAYLEQRAREQQILNEKLQQHVQSYPIQLLFPPNVIPLPKDEGDIAAASPTSKASKSTSAPAAAPVSTKGEERYDQSEKKPIPPLRTSSGFINFRLLETQGLEFTSKDDINLMNDSDDQQQTQQAYFPSLAKTTESLNAFVKDLESTNCYNRVQVVLSNDNGEDGTKKKKIGATTNDDVNPKKLSVLLDEKNWYKLYVGGGVKQGNIGAGAGTSSSPSSTGMLPKVQFETSASLINLTGMTDFTQCCYTIDQTSTPTLSFTHTRPLFSLFHNSTSSSSDNSNRNTTFGDTILAMDNGSKYGVTIRADIDTLDHEHTRSSKDHIQSVGIKVANSTAGSSAMNPAVGENVYAGIDWSLSHRDIIPRRHKSLPYLCDASQDIIACGGPSWKHSISGEYRLNGFYTDDKFNPTAGVDSYGGVEVAGPPGDVGFLKCWSGGSIHLPLGDTGGLLGRLMPSGLSLHSAYHCGMIKSLAFGGLCANGIGNMTNISDRYYVSGLRGFLPAGIGPRADTVSSAQ